MAKKKKKEILEAKDKKQRVRKNRRRKHTKKNVGKKGNMIMTKK